MAYQSSISNLNRQNFYSPYICGGILAPTTYGILGSELASKNWSSPMTDPKVMQLSNYAQMESKNAIALFSAGDFEGSTQCKVNVILECIKAYNKPSPSTSLAPNSYLKDFGFSTKKNIPSYKKPNLPKFDSELDEKKKDEDLINDYVNKILIKENLEKFFEMRQNSTLDYKREKTEYSDIKEQLHSMEKILKKKGLFEKADEMAKNKQEERYKNIEEGKHSALGKDISILNDYRNIIGRMNGPSSLAVKMDFSYPTIGGDGTNIKSVDNEFNKILSGARKQELSSKINELNKQIDEYKELSEIFKKNYGSKIQKLELMVKSYEIEMNNLQ